MVPGLPGEETRVQQTRPNRKALFQKKAENRTLQHVCSTVEHFTSVRFDPNSNFSVTESLRCIKVVHTVHTGHTPLWFHTAHTTACPAGENADSSAAVLIAEEVEAPNPKPRFGLRRLHHLWCEHVHPEWREDRPPGTSERFSRTELCCDVTLTRSRKVRKVRNVRNVRNVVTAEAALSSQ